jgi:hypothetical protein
MNYLNQLAHPFIRQHDNRFEEPPLPSNDNSDAVDSSDSDFRNCGRIHQIERRMKKHPDRSFRVKPLLGMPTLLPISTTRIDNAQYTDARYSQFTHVVRNQHINNMTTSPETLLTSLKPVRNRRFVMRCMEGTREGIFWRIDSWLDSGVTNIDAQSIFWISASPGVGKSANMSSLELRLRRVS